MEAARIHDRLFPPRRPAGLSTLFALNVVLASIAGMWRSIGPLISVWNQEEYSHAWLVLPLAILVFLQRIRSVQTGGSTVWGLPLVLLSVVLILFAWAAGSFTVAVYGAVISIIGFVWSSFGSKAMKTLAAPLIYLFFIVPLPVTVYILITADMQFLSSKLGITFVSLFRVPALLDGNIIVLNSRKLEVAEACSGLRFLFPLTSFAFFIAMLMEDRVWKKILIVLSSVPIAIVTNAIRIALTAVLLERFGLDTTTGSSHVLEAFAMFLLCLMLLFIEVGVLLKLGSGQGRFVASDLFRIDSRKFERVCFWPLTRTSFLTGTIILASAGFIALLPNRLEAIPSRERFVLFPMDFGRWHGTPRTLDRDSLDALNLTDYVLADYYTDNDAIERPLNFYVAYYASQRNGLHVHSPQLCIPGGGWSIVGQSIATVPRLKSSAIVANRVLIEKRGVRQLVYYWFEERGREIYSETWLKYYALRDALIDNRSDGALIRVVVPIQAGEEKKGDLLARAFIADVSPLLTHYIPGNSNGGP